MRVAVAIAFAVRFIALLLGELQPYSSIRETYFATAAGLASGYGYITETPVATANNNGFDSRTSVVQYMKQREAEGGRVDRDHPFPRDPKGWLPGTRHPHGYGTLVWLLYSVFNYTGTLWALHLIQILADSIACVFVFLFAGRLFNAKVGAAAAWLYALCPPAVFLSIDLLPDAFHGFFISLVLLLAHRSATGLMRNSILAGAALGLGCYFRTEYLLLPTAIFAASWAVSGRLFASLLRTGLMTVVMVVVLLPSALWMKSAIGEFRFTSTTGGGSMYVCLGEDPQNPLGIVNNDGWIHKDANKRGYSTAWDPEVDRLYGKMFLEYVRTHPGRYLRTVLVNRLPLALATPYECGNRKTRGEFNFTKYRIEEGLTRWGVLRKYPFTVLKFMWPQFAMLAYSAVLTLCLFYVVVRRRREWRRLAWLVLPWLYPVVTICLLKAVEPRNLGSTLPVLMVAAAVVIASRKASSFEPESIRNSPA